MGSNLMRKSHDSSMAAAEEKAKRADRNAKRKFESKQKLPKKQWGQFKGMEVQTEIRDKP